MLTEAVQENDVEEVPVILKSKLPPPLPVSEAEDLIHQLEAWLDTCPLHGWALRFGLRTRVAVANRELERTKKLVAEAQAKTVREAERANAEIRQEVEAKGAELKELRERALQARLRLSEASAKAGMTSIDGSKVHLKAFEAPPPAAVIAAMHGQKYVEPESLLRRALVWVAPLVLGPVVGLCLATIVGLLTASDLRHLDERWHALLFPAVLGVVCVFLLGSLAEAFGRTYGEIEGARDSQGQRSRLLFARLTVEGMLLALATTAELLTEALGIHELHLQNLAYLLRITGQSLGQGGLRPLHPGLAAIVAMIVTFTYVAYEVVRGRSVYAAGQAQALLEHLRWQWLRNFLSQEAVIEALTKAKEILVLQDAEHQVEREIRHLQRKLKPPPERYARAWTAAVQAAAKVAQRESVRFHHLVAQLVERIEPLNRFRGTRLGGARDAVERRV